MGRDKAETQRVHVTPRVFETPEYVSDTNDLSIRVTQVTLRHEYMPVCHLDSDTLMLGTRQRIHQSLRGLKEPAARELDRQNVRLT